MPKQAMSKRKADGIASDPSPETSTLRSLLPKQQSPAIKLEAPAPRRVESFILRPRIHQLKQLGPFSHFAYTELTHDLQRLVDTNGGPGPLLDEVANAFNKAHEVIELDIKIWSYFMQFGEIAPIPKSGLDCIHKWLPVTVGRLMGIQLPGALDMNWMFHFTGSMAAKDPFICGNVIQIQKAAAYMDGAIAAREMALDADTAGFGVVDASQAKLDTVLMSMSNGIRRRILDIETYLCAKTKFDQVLAEFEPYRLAARMDPTLESSWKP